jgi:hypothetical protein
MAGGAIPCGWFCRVGPGNRSVEDAAESTPARMPARPAESPRHEHVFIASGGPRGHGDSGVDMSVDAARVGACATYARAAGRVYPLLRSVR